LARTRPYALCIAGSDPSGGAGIFADLKTLEANKVYGLGVVSALTYQNDDTFSGVDWVLMEKIIAQARLVLQKFPVEVVKIGLIQNLPVLKALISFLQENSPDIKIIWDPVLKASAGFTFHEQLDQEMLKEVLNSLYVITPNVPEARQLSPASQPEESAQQLSHFCHVLLKGGHQDDKKGYDQLFLRTGEILSYRPRRLEVFPKHGSGCVLAAALAANLARGFKLPRAVLRAKQYTAGFLASNETLLGYHKL